MLNVEGVSWLGIRADRWVHLLLVLFISKILLRRIGLKWSALFVTVLILGKEVMDTLVIWYYWDWREEFIVDTAFDVALGYSGFVLAWIYFHNYLRIRSLFSFFGNDKANEDDRGNG